MDFRRGAEKWTFNSAPCLKPQRIDMQQECHLDGHPRRRAEEWTCNSARVDNAFNSIYRLNEQPEA